MRAVVTTSLCLAGCFTKPDPPSAAPAIDVRRSITITIPPDTELDDFPVSVVFQDADLSRNAASAANITFNSLDGAPLLCEIVSYDAASGTLEAWVSIPVLPVTAHTFQVFYGPSVVSTCGRAQPWEDFRGVWHFSDDDPEVALDSSGYQHDLTRARGTPLRSAGRIGLGLHLDANDGADEICMDDAPTLAFGTGPFTFELWVRPEQLLNDFDVPLYKGAKNAGYAGFNMELGMGAWIAQIRDAGMGHDVAAFTSNPGGRIERWSHLVAVVDRYQGRLRLFLDGEIAGTTMPLTTTSVNGLHQLCFGDASNPSDAVIDEVRLHAGSRSFQWIEEAYKNVTEPGFLEIGGPEPQ